MWYYHSAGWGWIMMAGWWAIVIIGIVVVMRTTHRGGHDAPAETSGAESILAQRLARGEIDAGEYRTRLSALQS